MGARRRDWAWAAWAATAAFGAYFCMYAFRKPFTAASFADQTLWGLDFKTALVSAQVLGYTLSKFLGVKVVSEIQPHRRATLLLVLIGLAELALLLFAVTPPPFNLFWLFCNGLPLGMVFGLVLGFLEGRRHTEALAAGLCASFIVADGVVKSAGAALLEQGVPERWMPCVAGLLFLLPLALFTWMLTRIPRPSALDVEARSARVPMDASDRWALFRRYVPGLTALLLVYLLVTILRSVRADFAPEIWRGLQGSAPAGVYAWSETLVGACVLVLFASMVLLRDNRHAFFVGLALAAGGSGLVAVALVALHAGALTPFAFMVLHGVGLYLPYIAVHTTVFERLLAMTRDRGNVGYLLYLADSWGYLGYVAVLFARSWLGAPDHFLSFFTTLSWTIALSCLVLVVPCWRYFARHPATRRVARAEAPLATGAA